MLHSVTFVGPCNGDMTFLIRGTLKAPTNPALFFTNTWIGFRYVDNLTVKGGGYLDGQGASAWHYNDCARNTRCLPLPIVSLILYKMLFSFSFILLLGGKKEVHDLKS